MEKEFNLLEYLSQSKPNKNNLSIMETDSNSFNQTCSIVEREISKEFSDDSIEVKTRNIEIQRRAIMGYDSEIKIYKEKIMQIVIRNKMQDCNYPSWYKSLEDGIFAELYGFAGLTPWIYDETTEYQNSSSAKLIGGKLYCLINGVSKLQPQRLSATRFEQLKRALLMATPKERLEKGFHEVYLKNGIRITIFSGERTKAGQEVIVFRKYLLKELSFDNLAGLGTIPMEAIPLFKAMIKMGFNVIFAGQVRSGKTTFMQVWQSYEDKSLEGLAIATDPETPWEIIMEDAPIMQLVADGRQLEEMTKSILRGDNDYVLLEEMRDAVAFNLALDITSTGTQRSKATIHDNDAVNIPYKMATKIIAKYGGNYNGVISQIFRNFNYVFEFFQLPGDKGKKKLKGIYEYCYDSIQDRVFVQTICHYNIAKDRWQWRYHLGRDKERITSDYKEERLFFETQLKLLEERELLEEDFIIYPSYYGGNSIGEKSWIN